ncbi:MAG: transcription termination factor Rho [Dehalococcoidia bacterium]|nr:MAG: transcription termination factor Rho [Dehalococcoidia bacterium]
MNIGELQGKPKTELLTLAKEKGVTKAESLDQQDLILQMLKSEVEQEGHVFCQGVLETMSDGYGFLRQDTMLPNHADVYISPSQIRRFGLRNGDMVVGQGRPPKSNEKYFSILQILAINDVDPEKARERPHFGSLTPTFPDRIINLEHSPGELSTRLLNMIAPIGRGQRGMIVSPPKAGKTMLLKAIASATSANYNDVHLLVCLIGERPEEVTDMKRSVKGEVISATFDEPVENQTRVAELALERAKRIVESGKDVFILLDGITRLTRAYNLAMPSSGRTLSGGIDPVALHPAKRFFGAARNTAEGGSLTIIATCLVDTGSRMDDLIYEEFKGTGNMELHLDRRLAERRVFPAMDIQRSGTRREELLTDENSLSKIWLLRRMVAMIASDSPNFIDATERILDRMRKTKTNAEFLDNLNKET